MTDPDQIAARLRAARERFGPVASSSTTRARRETAPFLKTSIELWQRMLDVNLTGTFLCAQAALPDMLDARLRPHRQHREHRGAARLSAMCAAYAAAKHGVLGLTRSLALEVARMGITVNAVCPGYTETDMLHASIANVVGKTGRSEAEALAYFAVAESAEAASCSPARSRTRCAGCAARRCLVNGAAIPISGGEVTDEDTINVPSHALRDADELGHEARAGQTTTPRSSSGCACWPARRRSRPSPQRLRERFGISLARFDYIAQLYRYTAASRCATCRATSWSPAAT